MRKGFICMLAISALVVAGCGGKASTSSSSSSVLGGEYIPDSKDPKEIKVQFVPSHDAAEIMLQAPGLEALLNERVPGHTFKVSVGTSYDATYEALTSGQVQIGFLTSQQYARASIEDQGKVNVLLASARTGMTIQLMDGTKEEKVTYMNTNSSYHAEADESGELVGSYPAFIWTTKEKYDAGLNSLKALEGKSVCTQGTSSGSGYVMPLLALREVGLTFTTGEPGAGEVKAIQISGHTAAAEALLRGDCDASTNYLDVRQDLYWTNGNGDSADTVNEAYKDLFATTRVIALSDEIMNDTISASTEISLKLQARIQWAFQDLIKTEAGLEAMKPYSHTGYSVVTDAAFAGERAKYIYMNQK